MASSCLSLMLYQKEEMKESSEATDEMNGGDESVDAGNNYSEQLS